MPVAPAGVLSGLATQPFQRLLSPGGNAVSSLGWLADSAVTDFAPYAATLNNLTCGIFLFGQPALPTASSPADANNSATTTAASQQAVDFSTSPGPSPSQAGRGPAGLAAVDGQLVVAATNASVALQCITWPGFSYNFTKLQGLGSGPSALTADFGLTLLRMQVGWNAIAAPWAKTGYAAQ